MEKTNAKGNCIKVIAQSQSSKGMTKNDNQNKPQHTGLASIWFHQANAFFYDAISRATQLG